MNVMDTRIPDGGCVGKHRSGNDMKMFLLGVMVAYTPSMVILAAMLWRPLLMSKHPTNNCPDQYPG